MKQTFEIYRTSDWGTDVNKPPFEGAYLKTKSSPALLDYQYWAIDLTWKDLAKIIRKTQTPIIINDSAAYEEYSIEIYDTYRE